MRNHRPVIFEDYNDSGDMVQREAGLERADLEITLSPGDFERLKEGRICPRCWEVQPEAFPEKCEALSYPDGTKGCGFPIRHQLTEWLDQNFGGGKYLGPTMSDADEFEQMREDAERRKRERNPKSRIWLP